MTPGPWEVASGLTGEDARHNGLVVTAPGGVAVADCENGAIPLAEQRRNARGIAALPDLIEALTRAEDWIGDLPRSPNADRVYRDIARALGRVRNGAAPPDQAGLDR